jgi:hypothetical protein
MSIIQHSMPEPDELSADDLFAELSSEFGIKAKPKTRAQKTSIGTYFPPAPKWKAVAIALLVSEQHCACGEVHKQSNGVFLEQSVALASRFIPYTKDLQTESNEMLPRRLDVTVSEISECPSCFGIEQKFREIGKNQHPFVEGAGWFDLDSLTPFEAMMSEVVQ